MPKWDERRRSAWGVKDGVLQQTSDERETWLTAGDPACAMYTLNVKAKKTGGSEGFLILVHGHGEGNYVWFNVGGWGNSASAIEQAVEGAKTELGQSSDFTVETGKWYDIRVEVAGRDIKCYIDNKLITQGVESSSGGGPTQAIFAAASRVDSSGDIILKVVNAGSAAQQLKIDLKGVSNVAKEATLETMSGQPSDVNTVQEPTKVGAKAVNHQQCRRELRARVPGVFGECRFG